MANFHGPTGTVWAAGALATKLDADPNYVRQELPEQPPADAAPVSSADAAPAKPTARKSNGESK